MVDSLVADRRLSRRKTSRCKASCGSGAPLFFAEVPPEIVAEIMSHLRGLDLASSASVASTWTPLARATADAQLRRRIPNLPRHSMLFASFPSLPPDSGPSQNNTINKTTQINKTHPTTSISVQGLPFHPLTTDAEYTATRGPPLQRRSTLRSPCVRNGISIER